MNHYPSGRQIDQGLKSRLNLEINLKHLCLKRPGTGIFYGQLKKIVGKKAKRNLKKNYQIKFTDIN